MAKNFKELRAKMSPEAQQHSREKARRMADACEHAKRDLGLFVDDFGLEDVLEMLVGISEDNMEKAMKDLQDYELTAAWARRVMALHNAIGRMSRVGE